jgi:hypothetical protein
MTQVIILYVLFINMSDHGRFGVVSCGGGRSGPLFLLFSVNESRRFCGLARMVSPVDFARDFDAWTEVGSQHTPGRMDGR